MPNAILGTSYVSVNIKLNYLEDLRHSFFKVPNSVLNVFLAPSPLAA